MKFKYLKQLIITVACLVCFFLYMRVHVVTGEGIGITIIPKISLAIQETFVNRDAITNLPIAAAKIRYPLSIIALKRAGLLKTVTDTVNYSTDR
jgi:hypothetical protein